MGVDLDKVSRSRICGAVRYEGRSYEEIEAVVLEVLLERMSDYMLKREFEPAWGFSGTRIVYAKLRNEDGTFSGEELASLVAIEEHGSSKDYAFMGWPKPERHVFSDCAEIRLRYVVEDETGDLSGEFEESVMIEVLKRLGGGALVYEVEGEPQEYDIVDENGLVD